MYKRQGQAGDGDEQQLQAPDREPEYQSGLTVHADQDEVVVTPDEDANGQEEDTGEGLELVHTYDKGLSGENSMDEDLAEGGGVGTQDGECVRQCEGSRHTGAFRAQSIANEDQQGKPGNCLLYTSPSPRDKRQSRMPSSA